MTNIYVYAFYALSALRLRRSAHPFAAPIAPSTTRRAAQTLARSVGFARGKARRTGRHHGGA
eukprot:31300-Pelagococcus_subviridis.AAC.4